MHVTCFPGPFQVEAACISAAYFLWAPSHTHLQRLLYSETFHAHYTCNKHTGIADTPLSGVPTRTNKYTSQFTPQLSTAACFRKPTIQRRAFECSARDGLSLWHQPSRHNAVQSRQRRHRLEHGGWSVSYTHLTLPTKRIV